MTVFIDNRKIHLGPKKVLFVEQLRKDAHFLAQLNIMDYSLLLGIHDRLKRTEEDFEAEGELPARSNTPFRNVSHHSQYKTCADKITYGVIQFFSFVIFSRRSLFQYR